ALEERCHGDPHRQEAGAQERRGGDRRERPASRTQDRHCRELGRGGEGETENTIGAKTPQPKERARMPNETATTPTTNANGSPARAPAR
ncbi:MAG: hypothetical protein M3P49_04630, partial [Actinomycetota bacterium]|nr:hypothetical protein [Actinomycetota bacterium]